MKSLRQRFVVGDISCDSVEVLYWRTVLWGFVWTDMEQLRGEGGGGGGGGY